MPRKTLAVLALLQPLAVTAGEMQITSLPSSDLRWERTPEGVAFAPLIGARFEEAYMAMIELPAGLISPAHIKSHDMFGVVVSGTMTHVATGSEAEPQLLPPGSFYRIPAGLAHVSSCISQEVCRTFLYQDGPFDFQPVTP